jgi:hypothetical protein
MLSFRSGPLSLGIFFVYLFDPNRRPHSIFVDPNRHPLVYLCRFKQSSLTDLNSFIIGLSLPGIHKYRRRYNTKKSLGVDEFRQQDHWVLIYETLAGGFLGIDIIKISNKIIKLQKRKTHPQVLIY